MSRQLEPYQLIERSIQKKFHKVLWTPFITAIKQYELIAPGDRIAVCISGGKDSMLMAKLLQLLLRELRRTNPDIEKSIFHSIHSVCLDTMVGYKSGGVEHTFADCYRERGEMAEMEKEDAE